MKLLIQIPCLNEEKTLPLVIESIPKKIKGVSSIKILVIDDGSTDNTVAVAKQLGVDYIIRHGRNKGLARSFTDGINECLRLGADIIVNTDADNQYPQKDIPRLIEPILKGRADMVIANRQTDKITHFSPLKKFFQWFGSAIVRYLSHSKIPDAVSGFRAYSRKAAMQLTVVTEFSYVIETIIQSQTKRIAMESVDVITNPPTRPSRLFKNMFQHMRHSGASIIRVYTMYRPLLVFVMVGSVIFLAGFLFSLRFTFYLVLGQGGGHIQSLILAAVLMMIGFQTAMTGLVTDLIAINRKIIEDVLLRIKKREYKSDTVLSISTKRKPRQPRDTTYEKKYRYMVN
ncbi:MAG TPA: glycosyltransferase family 2 protein [Candidatus Eisenbacteria bacterium]|nr:glycosyltransferase family 2 protein [Candidatus Eisenbacteria bacterium]